MIIAGVDEVGRGPLAGPVLACAVILEKDLSGLADSKTLSAIKREKLALDIKMHADAFAFGRVEARVIDRMNIHHASLLAMKLAIENLKIQPDLVLVDGLYLPPLTMAAKAIVKGDSLVKVISAASILAKVYRDAEMCFWDSVYPGYEFSVHKGYPTKKHIHALSQLGLCPIHRLSFSPIKKRMQKHLESSVFGLS